MFFHSQFVPFVRLTTVCRCGSSTPGKQYITGFDGEVIGARLSCKRCGAVEEF